MLEGYSNNLLVIDLYQVGLLTIFLDLSIITLFIDFSLSKGDTKKHMKMNMVAISLMTLLIAIIPCFKNAYCDLHEIEKMFVCTTSIIEF